MWASDHLHVSLQRLHSDFLRYLVQNLYTAIMPVYLPQNNAALRIKTSHVAQNIHR